MNINDVWNAVLLTVCIIPDSLLLSVPCFLPFSHHSVLWMDHLFNLLQLPQHRPHLHPHHQPTLQGWLHSYRWVHPAPVHTAMNRGGEPLPKLSVGKENSARWIFHDEPASPSDYLNTAWMANCNRHLTEPGVTMRFILVFSEWLVSSKKTYKNTHFFTNEDHLLCHTTTDTLPCKN